MTLLKSHIVSFTAFGFTFSLCEEFEMIAEKALTTPANTAELMELKAYIENVEEKTIYELENKLVQARNRLEFLVEYAVSTPQEIRLNNSTFQWYDRIPEVFSEHKLIIQEKQKQYEEALKVGCLILATTNFVFKFRQNAQLLELYCKSLDARL